MNNEKRLEKVNVALMTTSLIAILIILYFYTLLWIGEKTLPPLYFTGAAPTNPTVEGSLWLSIALKNKTKTDIVYINSWKNLTEEEYLVKNYKKVIILIIAPQKPYVKEDINSIKRLIKKAKHTILIIASEETVVNSLLLGLDSPLIISQEKIYSKRIGEEAYLVPVEITVANKTYILLANLAAPLLLVENQENGEWKISVKGGVLEERAHQALAIAAEETRRIDNNSKLTIFLLGDSFPFTNLAYFVDNKMNKHVYSSFVLNLIKYYAGGEKTLVIIDISKYLTLEEILSNSNLVKKYTNTKDREAALIASLLHPITWIPIISVNFNTFSANMLQALNRYKVPILSIELFLILALYGFTNRSLYRISVISTLVYTRFVEKTVPSKRILYKSASQSMINAIKTIETHIIGRKTDESIRTLEKKLERSSNSRNPKKTIEEIYYKLLRQS